MRQGITQLGDCYFSPPFKVMNTTENKTENPLHLMLMSSSPGVLDGDEYEMRIDVVAKGAVHLHTQSYQRLFDMQVGATQTLEVHLQEGASFTYLPHPCVPHENSIFKSKNSIYLTKNGSLVWGEIITCGRSLKGEVFTFSKFQSVTKVYLDHQLILKENIIMAPLEVAPTAIGQLEGYTHQASLLIFKESRDYSALIERVVEYLQEQIGIDFGITTTQNNGLVVRILGFKAEQLHGCLKDLAEWVSEVKTAVYVD